MKKYLGLMFFLGVLVFPAGADTTVIAALSDNELALARMRTQMAAQRQKEDELQLLQLEVERLKLEVEKKKAVVELGRLSSGGDAPAGISAGAEPVLALAAVFIHDTYKDALLNVDGSGRHVKEGDITPAGTVKSIDADGIVILLKDGQEQFFSVRE